MGFTRIHPDIHIGPMTLIVGDCLHVLQEIAEEDSKPGLLMTDPPYKLTSGGKNSNAMSGKFARDRYDNSGKLMHITTWQDMAGPIFNACKTDCDGYVMANAKNIFLAYNAFAKAGWKHHNLLYWRKPTPTRTRYYMKNSEFILYLWKGRARDITNGGTTQDLFFARPKDDVHDTQKPLPLLEVMIGNSCSEGDHVLDPFAGSGSSLVAAMRCGRGSIGIEINPDQAAISADWMQMQYDLWRREQDQGAD